MRKFVGVKVVLMWGLFFFIILISGQMYAGDIDIENLKNLNPELTNVDQPIGAFTFQINEKSGNVEVVQVIYSHELGWSPSFDQVEDNPKHVMVDGRLYSQQIYLATPKSDGERKMRSYRSVFNLIDSDDFLAPVPLNFDELKKINPKLEDYIQLETPITEDANIVIYAPQGSGIAFVTETNGDIYAMLRLSQEKGTWYGIPESRHTIHPELGELYYSTFYFKDPGDRFDLDQWFAGFKLDSIRTRIGDLIEPAYTLKSLRITHNFGMLQIEGEVLNETGNDYMMGLFNIFLYDSYGNIIEKGMLQAQNLIDGEEASFMGILDVKADIDLDELLYSIEFDYAM